jgi:hypothetical protein
MLVALGHEEHIPNERRCFTSDDDFLQQAEKMRSEKDISVLLEHLKVVYRIMEEQFEGIQKGREVINEHYHNIVGSGVYVSNAWKNEMIKRGAGCNCRICNRFGQALALECDLEHNDDKARELKASITLKPSGKVKGKNNIFSHLFMTSLLKHL